MHKRTAKVSLVDGRSGTDGAKKQDISRAPRVTITLAIPSPWTTGSEQSGAVGMQKRVTAGEKRGTRKEGEKEKRRPEEEKRRRPDGRESRGTEVRRRPDGLSPVCANKPKWTANKYASTSKSERPYAWS